MKFIYEKNFLQNEPPRFTAPPLHSWGNVRHGQSCGGLLNRRQRCWNSDPAALGQGARPRHETAALDQYPIAGGQFVDGVVIGLAVAAAPLHLATLTGAQQRLAFGLQALRLGHTPALEHQPYRPPVGLGPVVNLIGRSRKLGMGWALLHKASPLSW